MKMNRRRLSLDEASPGMVLAEPILDMHGGMLLPGATVLTEAMLASLGKIGVGSILVDGEPATEEELQVEQERIRSRLSRLFRRCSTEGACGALLRAIEDYRLRGVQ